MLENDCNQTYTYELFGSAAKYVGEGDMHDSNFDNFEVLGDFGISDHDGSNQEPSVGCQYFVKVYPSIDMEENYKTGGPLTAALSLVGIFLFTALVFLGYDWFAGSLVVNCRNWNTPDSLP